MTPKIESHQEQDNAALDDAVQHIMEHNGTLASAKGLTGDDIEAIYAVSYNLYHQCKFEQAEKTFSFLCLYSHLDVRFWIGLGACREGLAQYAPAIEAYSYAALLQHDNPVPPLQAAKCYLALDDLDQARNGLTAAIHWAQGKPQHQSIFTRARELLRTIDTRKKGTDS